MSMSRPCRDDSCWVQQVINEVVLSHRTWYVSYDLSVLLHSSRFMDLSGNIVVFFKYLLFFTRSTNFWDVNICNYLIVSVFNLSSWMSFRLCFQKCYLSLAGRRSNLASSGQPPPVPPHKVTTISRQLSIRVWTFVPASLSPSTLGLLFSFLFFFIIHVKRSLERWVRVGVLG